MHVLMVDTHLESPDDRYYEERASIRDAAHAAEESLEVIARAQDIRQQMEGWLTNAPGTALVLFHKGDDIFLSESAVMDLCRQHGAVLVVYGGGVGDEPREGYVRVSIPTLTENIEAFIRLWIAQGDSPGFEVLFGISTQESALCALSAALPFGLLREAEGSFDATIKRLSDNMSENPDPNDFEGLIRAYFCATAQRDELLAAIEAHHLGRALARGEGKRSIRKALEDLTKAMTQDSLDEWNAALGTLRDEWLSEPGRREGSTT